MATKGKDPTPAFERVSASAAQTRRLASGLGRSVEPGDVIGLRGPLGAGKTCFVQGLALGLGLPRATRVASPTFNIIQEHTARLPLYHVDLYRIGDAGELDEIGLREYLEGAGVCAIEWLDRFPGVAPADHLEVALSIEGARRRRIVVTPRGTRATALAHAWLAGLD